MKFDLEGWFPGQEGMCEDGRIGPVSVCNWSVRCLSDFILTFDAFTPTAIMVGPGLHVVGDLSI